MPGSITCGVTEFGGDPSPGHHKTCECNKDDITPCDWDLSRDSSVADGGCNNIDLDGRNISKIISYG